MVNEYLIPAQLLQAIVNVLNQRPAGEVFGLLVAIKSEVDRQNAEAKSESFEQVGLPTMGQNK